MTLYYDLRLTLPRPIEGMPGKLGFATPDARIERSSMNPLVAKKPQPLGWGGRNPGGLRRVLR